MTRTERLELYADYGAGCRRSYVAALADDHGVAHAVAFALANALGPDEDFDGLITALQDAEGEGY